MESVELDALDLRGQEPANDQDAVTSHAIKGLCPPAGIDEEAANEEVEADGYEGETKEGKEEGKRTGSLGRVG